MKISSTNDMFVFSAKQVRCLDGCFYAIQLERDAGHGTASTRVAKLRSDQSRRRYSLYEGPEHRELLHVHIRNGFANRNPAAVSVIVPSIDMLGHASYEKRDDRHGLRALLDASGLSMKGTAG